MNRPTKAAQGQLSNEPFPDGDWLKRFPTLCPFLGDVCWDDGEARELCTLTVKVQDGLILASLSDRELERGLYRTGRDVRSAIEALEKALANGSADWRPWKIPGGQKGKRG